MIKNLQYKVFLLFVFFSITVIDASGITLTCQEVLSGRPITVDVIGVDDIEEAKNVINSDISYSHVDTSSCIEGGYVITPMYPKEYNTNRPGMEYLTMELSRPNPQECEDLCAAEKRCIAWTYIKPSDNAVKAKCGLKKEVPDAVRDECCVSGVKKQRIE